MLNDWLADIVILNESGSEARAGDIAVFRSAGEACKYLEHWWVENSEGFAFTAAGECLTLGVDDKNRVVVTGKQAKPGGADIVLGWLRAGAVSILDSRRARAKSGKAILNSSEERGQLPTSADGLIAYIGFSS